MSLASSGVYKTSPPYSLLVQSSDLLDTLKTLPYFRKQSNPIFGDVILESRNGQCEYDKLLRTTILPNWRILSAPLISFL